MTPKQKIIWKIFLDDRKREIVIALKSFILFIFIFSSIVIWVVCFLLSILHKPPVPWCLTHPYPEIWLGIDILVWIGIWLIYNYIKTVREVKANI